MDALPGEIRSITMLFNFLVIKTGPTALGGTGNGDSTLIDFQIRVRPKAGVANSMSREMP